MYILHIYIVYLKIWFMCKTEKETQMYRTDFWTLWEKAMVWCSERIALKQAYYHGWNRSPAQAGCIVTCASPLPLLAKQLLNFPSLFLHPMVSTPGTRSRLSTGWLSPPLECNVARGRGLALHPLLCPQCLAPTRQVCAEWTGISCLWESCFPWSPPGQGPGGSGPTFAPGASTLQATECGTNSRTCRLGRVTPGHVPCNPGRALGRARSVFLSFALEPLQLRLEPPSLDCPLLFDSHALAPTQVRAPVFTPEPLLLSVLWALPPPLCHLWLFIQTI